jgi:hypothetical protein
MLLERAGGIMAAEIVARMNSGGRGLSPFHIADILHAEF